MGRVWIGGGSASGKSAFAEEMAGLWREGHRVFLATGWPSDGEMAGRIEMHRQRRLDGVFVHTVELPPHEGTPQVSSTGHPQDSPPGQPAGLPPDEIQSAELECARQAARLAGPQGLVLIDSLTTLVARWLEELPAASGTKRIDASGVPMELEGRLSRFYACFEAVGCLLTVSDEVGWGVVPEHPAGRRFRDVLGAANRWVAAGSDACFLVVAGIPWQLKPAAKIEPPWQVKG